MSTVKKICICAFCAALCCVLPMAFHAMALGKVFSPMHIPVLLCGLVCGWPWGTLCGLAGPVLSSALTGMPAAAALIHMVPELCIYGLCAGLFLKLLRTGRTYADLLLAQAGAMLAGRIVGGAAQGLFYLATARGWSVALWAGAYFVQTLPGAVLHLLAVPALVLILMRTGLIPRRYGARAAA